MTQGSTAQIGSYLPDLVRSWPIDRPGHIRVAGSLVSADISGFTALSERLAAHGREGAEELTNLLNQCFGGMIEIIDAHDGDVLKFGGDALLVLFEGPHHTARAATACIEMRELIERRWSTGLVKRIELGISQGIHSGTFDLHLVDAGHRELLVVGPGMSATVNCEGAAERGQILLSHDAAALLDEPDLGDVTTEGRALIRVPPLHDWVRSERTTVEASDTTFVPSWLAEQTAAGVVAEHRTVTVGFVFFGGVDDLLTTEGPDVVNERLQALATATREAADKFGVFWLASDVYAGGGKIILTAGAPRSTGQDEDAAVRAARALIETDVGLPVRIGLNRGPVYMGDLGSSRRRTFTVMGDAVNLAARLMQKSTAGQVVASQAVLDLIPTPMKSQTLEPFLVKGKTEPIRASLVGELLVGETQESEAASVPTVGFAGRNDELRRLAAAIEQAADGRGLVVDVVGEPGIGKSRLVDEAMRDLGDGITIVSAKGGLYSRTTPYFAVSTMLRRLIGIDRSSTPASAGRLMSQWVMERAPAMEPWMPLLAIAFAADVPSTPEVDRIDPANRAGKLREVVVDLLTAAIDGPLVFVVDDAHRLDEASDEVFAAVARRIANRPWLLISLRWRDHTTFIDALDDRVRIDVGPLAPAEAEAVARAATAGDPRFDPDDVDDLIARGVTNPLFLLELARSGIERGAATPDSIETVVTARIDTLTSADRLLLREASVLGSVIDTHLLAEALGDQGLRGPERWTRLSGFLSPVNSNVFNFQQGLYREVAYEGLSFKRRRELHAQFGQAFERRAGEDWASSSELLSLHYHAARIWPKSWRYSIIAGDLASSKYAHTEAAIFYRRALDVPPAHRPDLTAVTAVAESLADALELSAQFDEASHALQLARRTRSDVGGLIRLMRKSGVIMERLGKYRQALRWYGRGLTAAVQLEEPTASLAEGDLALAYSGVRFRQGRLHEALKWAHRAESIGRRLDDPKIIAHSSYLLTAGYAMLRRPEVAEYDQVSLPLYEQLGDLVGQGNVLNNLGVNARDDSQWDQALDYYERSRIVRNEAGDVIGAATAIINIAEILAYQGHIERAEQLFTEATRSCRRTGYEIGYALAAGNLGRLYARLEDYDRARELQTDAIERMERVGATAQVLEIRVMRVECETLARNGALALTMAQPLLEEIRAWDDPLLEPILLRIVAWAHMVEGDADQAEQVAIECIAMCQEEGLLYEEALCEVLVGQLCANSGRDRTPHHRRARALLGQLGVVQLPHLAEVAMPPSELVAAQE